MKIWQGLVTDAKSRTDMRGHHTRSYLDRKERLRMRKVKAPAYLRTAQSAGPRGGLDDGNRWVPETITFVFWGF